MKKLVLLIFTFIYIGDSYSQDCNSYGNAQIDLNVNNIKARLLNSGDLWWDGASGKYIAPNLDLGYPEVTAIFAGALWFGAYDPNGALKVAAQKYRFNNKTDFFPGPISSVGNSPTSNDCQNWDRFWAVNKSDIDNHISDFEDNNIIDNPHPSIYSWPGRNNPSFMSNNGFDLPLDHNLAPFFDRDQDGNYNPGQGDYPLIKGDQSIWWVFNDLAGLHRVTQGTPMAIEVQAMAYAEASSNENINNTTYYDFKITNRGTEELLSAYMGLWVDFDFGCPVDDYLGYNEEYQMMYAYNEDNADGQVGTSCPVGINTYGENIPIIGIKQIGTPDFPVTSYSVFERLAQLNSGPDIDYEYYNILKGLWKDGTPMTFGGSGFDPASTDSVSFLFTGEPSDENSWSMCTADLGIESHQCVMSTGMGNLQPGQSFTNSYAVIFVENEDYPCPNLDRLKKAADDVCENVFTTISYPENKFSLELFPNPAKDILHIKSGNSIQRIQVISIGGQLLQDSKLSNTPSDYSLSLENLSDGLYFILVQDQFGRTSIEKVIVQR